MDFGSCSKLEVKNSMFINKEKVTEYFIHKLKVICEKNMTGYADIWIQIKSTDSAIRKYP